MKKILAICVLLALSLSLVACGAEAADNYMDMDMNYSAKTESSIAYDGGLMLETESVEAPETAKTSEQSIVAGRKIIYSSWYDIQTEEYDKTTSALNELCKKYNAYFESSNTYGSMSEYAMRSADYTVRVPLENYHAFLKESATIGTVVRSGENNQDITEKYFDTEARLDSAKLREERLLEILANADSLDDVLLLEKELSDVRYEIESYTGTLRKYDGLISYATAKIGIEEVARVTDIDVEKETLGSRISKSFNRGWGNFVDDLQDFLVDFMYALPTLLFFWLPVAIVITVIVILVKRRNRKKRLQRAAQQPFAEPPKK